MNFEKEKRRQVRLERLGMNDPRCGLCGETDDRTFEAHHVSGQKYDDATVVICRNCHRMASDDQKDHPAAMGGMPSLLERIGHLLIGMADMLALLAEQCRKFAALLFEALAAGKFQTGDQS